MSRILAPEEEDFLFFLVRTHYREDKNRFNNLLNLSIVQQAVDSFLSFFEYEDKLKKTNHIKLIRKIFVEADEITTKYILSFGISIKTYYRYKTRYLQIFKNYLYKNIGNDIFSI